MTAAAAEAHITPRGGGVLWTFLAICRRDVAVLVRDWPSVVMQVAMQPLFLAFVLGRVLPELGLARPRFAEVLLPGIVGLTVVIAALQAVALPLVLEFGFTKEIEDRLLAPLPVTLVGVEKIVMAALRGVVGGLVIFPLARLIIGWDKVDVSSGHIPRFLLFCAIGALLGSSLGLALGTFVPPKHISVMFAIIFTPVVFTGCIQYPWASLEPLEWFKVLTLFNPLTYASEGLRASLVPHVPHMTPWIAAVAGGGWIAGFVVLGLRGFRRRAVD
jgi:ABC-2 type transport system permease protein